MRDGRQAILGLFNPRPTHSELQTASPNLCPYLKLLLRLKMGPTELHPVHKSNSRGPASDGRNAGISVVPLLFSFKVNSPDPRESPLLPVENEDGPIH